MHHCCIVDVSKYTLPISLARISNQIVFVSYGFFLCIYIYIYNIIIIIYISIMPKLKMHTLFPICITGWQESIDDN